jgi:cell division protein FtsL
MYIAKKQTRRQKRQAIRFWFWSASCRTALFAFVVVFGVMYVFQTNTLSTKGFEISELEQNIRTLQQETQKMDAKIASYRSMQSIQSRLQGMDLVAVDTVTYRTPTGNSVAKR